MRLSLRSASCRNSSPRCLLNSSYNASRIAPLKSFSKTLRSHAEGICNYAAYPITSAVIEAGNVGIGLIRKRARGLLDTEYFKLKIRQLNLPDTAEPFYPLRGPGCRSKKAPESNKATV